MERRPSGAPGATQRRAIRPPVQPRQARGLGPLFPPTAERFERRLARLGITDVRSRVTDVARIRPLDLIGEQAIPVAAEPRLAASAPRGMPPESRSSGRNAAPRANSTPDPPGPPGFSSSYPICWAGELADNQISDSEIFVPPRVVVVQRHRRGCALETVPARHGTQVSTGGAAPFVGTPGAAGGAATVDGPATTATVTATASVRTPTGTRRTVHHISHRICGGGNSSAGKPEPTRRRRHGQHREAIAIPTPTTNRNE